MSTVQNETKGYLCASNYNAHLGNHSEINGTVDSQWNLEPSTFLSPVPKRAPLCPGNHCVQVLSVKRQAFIISEELSRRCSLIHPPFHSHWLKQDHASLLITGNGKSAMGPSSGSLIVFQVLLPVFCPQFQSDVQHLDLKHPRALCKLASNCSFMLPND